MKFVIAFALIAAAVAVPEPISLPKAALPAFEEEGSLNAKPVELPQAELPAYEDDAIPAFEAIDISPMLVPEEVMEAVRIAQLTEIMHEPVKIVDNAEEFVIPADAMAYEMPVEAIKALESPEAVHVAAADDFAVRVIENAENAVPLAEESFAVRVVEIAENLPASLDEQLAAGELEAIKLDDEVSSDAVRFVDAPFRRPGKIFDDPRMR